MANCCEMWIPHSHVPYNDYWNQEDKKAMRVAMKLNDFEGLPKECKACLSSSTSHSKFYEERTEFHETAKLVLEEMHEDGFIEQPRITFLAIGTSNKCSMACRMCTPNVSSKKWDLLKKLDLCQDSGRIKSADIKEWLNVIENNLGTLREVTIHGGDPAISDGVYEILEALKPIADTCRINFLSNGEFCEFPNGKNIFEVLSGFNIVRVVFSLDSFPEVNDYIRMFGKTSRCLKHMKMAYEILPSEHKINVHATLTNYSAVYFREYLDFITTELSFVNWFTVNNTINPSYYAPHNLPDEIKAEVFKKLMTFKSDRQDVMEMKKQVLKSLTSSKCDYTEFNKALWIDRKSDEVSRGFEMLKIFPMFEPYIIQTPQTYTKEDVWQ